MGVSLTYRTAGGVPPEVAAEILRDAESVVDAWDWWCESLMFWRDGDELEGDTDLFNHAGDPDDEDFMAMRDVVHIVRTLTEWSSRYNVDWELMLAGEEIGNITQGAWDEELQEFVDEVTEDWPDTQTEVNAKAAEILRSVFGD